MSRPVAAMLPRDLTQRLLLRILFELAWQERGKKL